MENKYLSHLLISMLNQEQNSINQIGKSDIEPPDYQERIEKWYAELRTQIQQKEPLKYVRSVNVFEKAGRIIDVEYNYYDANQNVSDTTINIYYIR